MIASLPPAPVVAPRDEPRLGVGRSGVVFRSTGTAGQPVARKVFDSGWLTRLVQYGLLGASNPYAWNIHALRCAFLRRRILAPLVETWMGGRLVVARALGHGWDDHYKAYQLHTGFSVGRAPALHHPLERRGRGEVRELLDEVLAPLQAHLREAGFDGQLWQAGLGNPVALANFLLEETPGGGRRWVWIDLESGVPALFPAQLPTLWRTYLPLCWKHRRPLFDDVDCQRLAAYVEDSRLPLDPDTRRRMIRDVASLSRHQRAWKEQPRLLRGITSQVVKGKLTAARAEYYSSRPLHWMAAEGARAARGLLNRARHGVLRNWSRLTALPWRKVPRGMAGFVGSQGFREKIAHRFVLMRIDHWQRRGQLSAAHADALREHAAREGSSVWLSDFAVHVGIKPLVKAIEWFVFPVLLVAGVVDETTVGIAILAGGSVSRSVYTLGRMVYDALHRRELAWIALATGILPVLGNLAFPLQIAWSSRDGDDLQAQFILYDGMSVIGKRLPIWGGPDTLTEHWLNEVPDRVVLRGSGSS